MRHHRILGAVGTLVLWAAGCAVPAPTRNEELVRVERQLAELYRPLLALVRESHASVQDFMKSRLGGDWIFPLENEAEVQAWLEQGEVRMMPRNVRMCALVVSKPEPADGPDLPPNVKP